MPRAVSLPLLPSFLPAYFFGNSATSIDGTGPIDEVEVRRSSVKIKLNPGVTASQVVDLRIFERFTFDSSQSEAEEKWGPADKFESDRAAMYSEYIRPQGRIQFYLSRDFVQWIEVIPNDLFADHFLSRHIAKHLDLSLQSQSVYIPIPYQQSYMTVYLSGKRISRVAWLPNVH